MTKQPLQKPTASELEILRVLWERGPSTVREVHDALSEKKDLGYTTVLKLLQIMTAKGTVRRNDEQRSELDFAGHFAHAGLDVVAFPLARRGAGGVVCRGCSGLQERFGTLRAGCWRARIDADIPGHHLLVVAGTSESGRTDRGGRSFDVGGNVH